MPSSLEKWKIIKRIIRRRNAVTRLRMFYLKDLKNMRNSNGKSLLYVSSKYGNLKVTKLLVRLGCNINLKDEKHGYTPLSRALNQDGKEYEKIVKFLVKSGADMSWKNLTIKDHLEILFKNRKVLAAMSQALTEREGGWRLAADHLRAKGWTLDNCASLQDFFISLCAVDETTDVSYKKLQEARNQENVPLFAELVGLVSHSKRILSWLLPKEAKTLKSLIIFKLLFDYGAPVNGFPGDGATPLENNLSSYNINSTSIILDYGAKLENINIIDSLYCVWSIFTASEVSDEPENCIRLLVEHQGVRNMIDLLLEPPKAEETYIHGILELKKLIIEYLSRHYILSEDPVKFFEYNTMYPDESDENFSYFTDCFEELVEMKKYKFEGSISAYNAVTKTINEMVPLTRNVALTNKIRSKSFNEMFPCHGKTLQFKLERAHRKRLMIDFSITILGKCLPQISSCYLVLERIIYYLGVPNLLLLELYNKKQ